MTQKPDVRIAAARTYVSATSAALWPGVNMQDPENNAQRGALLNAVLQGIMSCSEFAAMDARIVMFAVGTAAGSGFNNVPQEHWPQLVEAMNNGLGNGIAIYAEPPQGNA